MRNGSHRRCSNRLEFSTNMPISYRNVPPRCLKLLIHTQAILDKTSAICQQKTSTNPNTRISDAQTAQCACLYLATSCSIFMDGSHRRCSQPLIRSPIRSPIHVKHIISLTNSLTNSISYHIRSQISHLTVLNFAHQFATSRESALLHIQP